MSHHVIQPRTYARTFRILIALTVVTIAVSLVDLGAWNAIVALAIASTKAALVGLYFMGLKWAGRLIRVSLVVSLAGVVILFGGVLNDDRTRGTKTYLPAEEIGDLRDFQVRGLDGLGTSASQGGHVSQADEENAH